MEVKTQAKLGSFEMELERTKYEHKNEIDSLKSKYENQLKEIGCLHEQEGQMNRIEQERLIQEVKSLKMQLEESQ